MSNEKRHQSGSPASWKLRRAQYRQHRVSNPNDPSPTNRKARRFAAFLERIKALPDFTDGTPEAL